MARRLVVLVPGETVMVFDGVRGVWVGARQVAFEFERLDGNEALGVAASSQPLSILWMGRQVSRDHSSVPLRVDGRYSLQEPLSLGAYATVYKAVNIINRQIYAIKLEACSEERISSVEREYYILKQLCSATAVGVPQVHWFGRESSFDAMVLDLLGPSLHDLLGF
ncbi:hypothetical protein PISMIDRAFT_10317 [Pisolithus microcarpus 441]|uniref:Protein kinase domain-containing protein n=1 Tax=Pisolithus microcarpus 441 TaxID=765257 RepID=A0A0C9Z5D3_9AGAM|nr:hypothetical protein PISMIDRAFT_10317 [Pisolithus microcarpus 441]